MSETGRIEKLGKINWASALEKFPGYSEIISEISDLAAVTGSSFAEADSQNQFARDDLRPNYDACLTRRD